MAERSTEKAGSLQMKRTQPIRKKYNVNAFEHDCLKKRDSLLQPSEFLVAVSVQCSALLEAVFADGRDNCGSRTLRTITALLYMCIHCPNRLP
jgi:hypothetical protein